MVCAFGRIYVTLVCLAVGLSFGCTTYASVRLLTGLNRDHYWWYYVLSVAIAEGLTLAFASVYFATVACRLLSWLTKFVRRQKAAVTYQQIVD